MRVAPGPFGCLAREGGRVAIPAIAIVVGVDHGNAGIPRCLEHLCQRRAAFAERGEKRLRVLVVEVSNDVDHQEGVAVLELDGVRPAHALGGTLRGSAWKLDP